MPEARLAISSYFIIGVKYRIVHISTHLHIKRYTPSKVDLSRRTRHNGKLFLNFSLAQKLAHIPMDIKTFFGRVKENWKSGLTVALVSIPLSISIAVASGASPVNGIVTAIWAGLIASLFSSSRFNIVGPAGALTAILATAASAFGPAALSTLAVISGIFILIAWLFKFDKYINYIPSSVVYGFTLSVAIVIGLSQLNYALGLTGLTRHAHFIENVLETLKHLGTANPTITAFFVLSLAFLFILLKLVPKIPGAVVLAPIAILIGYLAKTGIAPMSLITLGDVFPNLSLSLFSVPSFSFNQAYIIPCLTIALVAILETELSAKIADNMTSTKHNRRKEVFGLGLANIVSGFFGGLPATGVFVRTSLNARSGAKDKTSQGLNSIFVAAIAIVFLSAFNYIPMAAIAAILIFAAIRMVEVHHFKRMLSFEKTAFGIAIAVAIISVYQDALIGILVGTVASLIIFIEKLSKGQFELVINKDKKIIDRVIGDDIPAEKVKHITDGAHVLVYSIKGPLTYTNAEAHIERFEHKLNNCETIVLRLKELAYIDMDGVEALEEIIRYSQKNGRRLIITGITNLVAKKLDNSKGFKAIRENGDVFDRTHHALNALGYNIGGTLSA